jgi:PhnB protein
MWVRNTPRWAKVKPVSRPEGDVQMAKAAKKKSKTTKKSARMTAKTKAVARSAKTAKTAKKKPATRKKTASKVDPLNRKEYRSVTPNLAVSDVRRAMNFYMSVFGFKAKSVMDSPHGVMHAELALRDTILMLSPESRQQNNLSAASIGNTPMTLYILVDDVDEVFAKAVSAGAQILMPLMDMFWGDRCGTVSDPDGNKWMIATHKSQPTEAEMAEAMRRMQGGQQPQAAAAAGTLF